MCAVAFDLALADSSAAKGYRSGTHRLVAPAETVARIARLAPALGITRVANVTGLDTVGLPVVMVCRPNSRSLSVAQGKGLSLEAAKASGLMESVESYHGERITLPVKLATYNELRYTHRVVDVRTLLWRQTSLYHDDFRILWIEGVDLLADEAMWLPFELVHVDLTLPSPTGSGCFVLSSNGLASGNHLLEAVNHAICEVVERHAYARWLRLEGPHLSSTRVDIDSIDDPSCRHVLDLYERAAISVAIWDLSGEIGIPAFRCSVADRRPDPMRPMAACGGMGCHPERGIALLRALTEAAQSRLTMIAGSRDDLHRSRYELSRNLDTLERWRQEVASERGTLAFGSLPTHDSATFEGDLQWLLSRLAATGVEHVIWFDLRKTGLDIPVVRVVIPGLEGLPSMCAYVPRSRVSS